MSVILLAVTLRVGVDGLIILSRPTVAFEVVNDESFSFSLNKSSIARTFGEKANAQQKTKSHLTIIFTTTNLC